MLFYSFARVSAADSLWVADYYAQGPRWFFRLRSVQLMISDDHKSLKAAAAPLNILTAVNRAHFRGKSVSR